MSAGGRKNGQDGRSTVEARARARERIKAFNRRRHLAPKCGAKARSTGEACGNVAMKNGRCRFHGGRVPSKGQWHRPQWPKGDAPAAISKADRKAADLEKRARQRAKRLARRSPEEIAEHEAWQRTHRPGSAKQRKADRELRRQNAEARSLLNGLGDLRQRSPADQTLADALAAAEGHLRALEREADIRENWNSGVFE